MKCIITEEYELLLMGLLEYYDQSSSCLCYRRQDGKLFERRDTQAECHKKRPIVASGILMFIVKTLERRADGHARTAYKLDSEDPINDRFSGNG
jgi:hypothetical protein